jgi:DNA-binding IclR family transcriptional regulator
MSSDRTGTQSIARAISIMRTLTRRPRSGFTLSDLARQCNLDKGTARRILNCLVQERLADRSPRELRYLPGPLLFELGLALPQLEDFKNASLPILQDLADQTHTLAFLCLRSGDDIVCAARVGDVPSPAITLTTGMRRPINNSAAGAALLVALPQEEREAVFERNCQALLHTVCLRTVLERVLQDSLDAGMGCNEGCFRPRWNSYALPLHNSQDAWASVMIAASSDMFTKTRRESSFVALRNAHKKLQDMTSTILDRQHYFEATLRETLALARVDVGEKGQSRGARASVSPRLA